MPKVPDGDMFRVWMLGYGAITFLAAFFIELVIVEYFLEKKYRYAFHKIEKSRKKFLSIENYLRLNSKWPPLSLYNNQENNSPDESPSNGGGESGASATPKESSKDDDNDDISPMSYAEISIEPIEDDGAVHFDRNSSILNSFFERERSRLNTMGESQESPDMETNLLNGHAHNDVFQETAEIKRRNQQLKREYLELKLNDTTLPKPMHDQTTNLDNSVELKKPNI
jgi:hypothetical protein